MEIESKLANSNPIKLVMDKIFFAPSKITYSMFLEELDLAI